MAGFKSIIPRLLQLGIVRYGIAAGTATVADIATYTLLRGQVIPPGSVYQFPGFALSGISVAAFFSVSTGALVNYLISKYWVFPGSAVKQSSQLFRFAAIIALVYFSNVMLMKYLYTWLPTSTGLRPPWSDLVVRSVSAGVVGVFSYILHRFVSFEMHRKVK